MIQQQRLSNAKNIFNYIFFECEKEKKVKSIYTQKQYDKIANKFQQ